ncbi:acyl-CoA thioester hydrolase [Pseudonocardia thermophila]|uniref:Acyl-CoA thioester hydrolase n=1 Tax=Pseudonocardia thermophila TaxID=1848 RepID=A0A1M6QLL1_PSETH|nr:acyl-CoA thioester hydrolase [Pseudonocardia thermophila]
MPADFPVLIDETPRYSDLDTSRRIGRDALVRWFEDARVAVEYQSFGADITSRERSQIRLFLASVQVDVLAPLTVAGTYRVGVGITRMGTSSVTYSYAVFNGAECVAVGSSVSVHVGEDGAAPLPESLRNALASLQMPGEAEPIQPLRETATLVREHYPFRLDVRTRFTDVDTNRHVNNVALARWYLDGLAELHLDVLGYPTGGPLDGLEPSSLRVDYLSEVHYPGIYQLRVGVVSIDDHTVRYQCGLFDGPRCVGLADATGAHRAQGVGLADSLAPWAMRG